MYSTEVLTTIRSEKRAGLYHKLKYKNKQLPACEDGNWAHDLLVKDLPGYHFREHCRLLFKRLFYTVFVNYPFNHISGREYIYIYIYI